MGESLNMPGVGAYRESVCYSRAKGGDAIAGFKAKWCKLSDKTVGEILGEEAPDRDFGG